MQDNDKTLSRATMLAKLAIAPLAIGALAAITLEEADAAGKSPQKAVQYVTHPVGGKKCAACQFFLAAKKDPAKANGQCKIVAGAISPNGYCVAFAPKS